MERSNGLLYLGDIRRERRPSSNWVISVFISSHGDDVKWIIVIYFAVAQFNLYSIYLDCQVYASIHDAPGYIYVVDAEVLLMGPCGCWL